MIVFPALVAALALAQPAAPERVLEATTRVVQVRLEHGATFVSRHGEATYKNLIALSFTTGRPGQFVPRGAPGALLMLGEVACSVMAERLIRTGEAICLAPWPEQPTTSLWLAGYAWNVAGATPASIAQQEARARGANAWLEVRLSRQPDETIEAVDVAEAIRRLSEPR